MRSSKAWTRGVRLAWLFCLAGVSTTVLGAEFVTDAEVVSVEPIVRYQTIERRAEHCVTRPHRNAGLVALISWDLAAGECARREQREIIDGYRVTYQWDGRRYHQTMAEHPGATLRIAVQVH